MPRRKKPKADRTEWFRDAKFGLFIHWGVYAILGKGEWIQHVGQIPVDEYEKLPPKFNPTKFDADAWAQLAKRAGMKYMTITTKHHDGFCMWDTKTTDYNVMNTPFASDVIGEVTRAFRKAGLRVSYYYSIMDWHHPDYLPRRPWEMGIRPEGDAKLSRYLKYMRAQIKELLTRYGRIGAVWYDGGWEHTAEELESAMMNRIWRKMQPDILINNRSNTPEDFGTPEQYIPPTGVTDDDGNPILWENCITMTSHWWGYDKHEKTYKSVEWLIRTFVDIVSKGGNLLLNVGPKPDGTIQREFVVRLEAMGKWLDKFGEAIYGTTASPFPRLPFDYRATVKSNRLYYFVFNWPADGVVRIPGLKNEIKRAALLAPGRPKLTCERDGGDWLVTVPKKAPDRVASVIRLTLDGVPQVEPLVVRPDEKGVVHLPASLAHIVAQHGQRARFEIVGGEVQIRNWTNPNDQPSWEFTLPKGGEYRVIAECACPPGSGGTEGKVIAGKQEASFKVRATKGADDFRSRTLATIKLKRGTNVVSLEADAIRKDIVMNVRGLTLRPA
jgi:alpha-L-fucosidase